jgi:magnesium chelatase family protein
MLDWSEGRCRRKLRSHPFRAPHHTIAAVGLISGSQVPRPGEVSLAHHGLLLVDERPEFKRHVLEVLRQLLETCAKVIARYAGHIAQYLDDGLLVYFGYPQAHEDDALRAVRAGLGMVEALG